MSRHQRRRCCNGAGQLLRLRLRRRCGGQAHLSATQALSLPSLSPSSLSSPVVVVVADVARPRAYGFGGGIGGVLFVFLRCVAATREKRRELGAHRVAGSGLGAQRAERRRRATARVCAVDVLGRHQRERRREREGAAFVRLLERGGADAEHLNVRIPLAELGGRVGVDVVCALARNQLHAVLLADVALVAIGDVGDVGQKDAARLLGVGARLVPDQLVGGELEPATLPLALSLAAELVEPALLEDDLLGLVVGVVASGERRTVGAAALEAPEAPELRAAARLGVVVHLVVRLLERADEAVGRVARHRVVGGAVHGSKLREHLRRAHAGEQALGARVGALRDKLVDLETIVAIVRAPARELHGEEGHKYVTQCARIALRQMLVALELLLRELDGVEQLLALGGRNEVGVGRLGEKLAVVDVEQHERLVRLLAERLERRVEKTDDKRDRRAAEADHAPGEERNKYVLPLERAEEGESGVDDGGERLEGVAGEDNAALDEERAEERNNTGGVALAEHRFKIHIVKERVGGGGAREDKIVNGARLAPGDGWRSQCGHQAQAAAGRGPRRGTPCTRSSSASALESREEPLQTC
jgi:hypothetical protein